MYTESINSPVEGHGPWEKKICSLLELRLAKWRVPSTLRKRYIFQDPSLKVVERMGSVAAKALEEGNDYKHDPLEGFSSGRKPRGTFWTVIYITVMMHTQISIVKRMLFGFYYAEIKATLAEMESAKIPLENRDYCVDYLLKYLGCRSQTWPLVYKCHHDKHEYLHCQYEE